MPNSTASTTLEHSQQLYTKLLVFNLLSVTLILLVYILGYCITIQSDDNRIYTIALKKYVTTVQIRILSDYIRSAHYRLLLRAVENS